MQDLDQLSQQISVATHTDFEILSSKPIGGGCINQACELIGDQGSYFVKFNHAELLPMFEAEFYGLQEMTETQSIKVPDPIVFGCSGNQAFLVLEMLRLGGVRGTSLSLMGAQLAQMHSQKQAYFGWHRENTIGSTRQINSRSEDWVDFFTRQRIQFQLQLASANGFRGRIQERGARLCEKLRHFFDTYSPQAALLHGDLWSGNAAVDQQGNPVIFDPACYYGDHEADLAMTELFGGFGADFHAAYRDHFPVDDGYSSRKQLYNLYHILNHLNLFGSGYLGQAESMIERLLAEL